MIGIDPGLTRTGYAVLERGDGRPAARTWGVLRTGTSLSTAARLAELRSGLCNILEAERPACAAVERVFFNANVRTAIAVGQASGVALATVAEYGIEVADYTPTEVKQSVAGFGAATKEQVGRMVANLLGLPEAPAPPDAADACALAICHLNRGGLVRAIKEALG